MGSILWRLQWNIVAWKARNGAWQHPGVRREWWDPKRRRRGTVEFSLPLVYLSEIFFFLVDSYSFFKTQLKHCIFCHLHCLFLLCFSLLFSLFPSSTPVEVTGGCGSPMHTSPCWHTPNTELKDSRPLSLIPPEYESLASRDHALLVFVFP